MCGPKPCWHIWGVNALYRCVRPEGHSPGHQYVYVGRDARRTEDNQVPATVNP